MNCKLLALLPFLFISSVSLASAPLSKKDILTQITEVAQNYAKSISCETSNISNANVVELTPYSSDDATGNYVVLWAGDIGCAGGSGTVSSNILRVGQGAYNSFLVIPDQSSPVAKFDIPVGYIEKLISHTSDSLTLEGMAFGENDAPNFPSIPTRFTIKSDKNGNWKTINQQIIKSIIEKSK